MQQKTGPEKPLRAPRWNKFPWSLLAMAFCTWVCVALCVDPAGSYPGRPQGPGLTVDEIFNVEQGIYLIEQTRALGWLNLVPGTSQEAYRPQNGYNPDHPPLGRFWLGLHHHLTWWLSPPRDPAGIAVTACARTGSATALALLVLLLGTVATKWSGKGVGVMTALSVVLMPRLFGHAHLASLETVTNLTCSAAVLGVAAGWNGAARPSWKWAVFAGVLLGLAFLTKIQAIMIPIPVICWTLWRWGRRGLPVLVVWGLAAFVVFIASWPYLWIDPFAHLKEYLGRTTDRMTLYVWYFGQRYADKSVPWHYPSLMFLMTVPLILHFVGGVGLFSRTLQTRSVSKDSDNKTPLAGGRGVVQAPSASLTPEFYRDILLLGCLVFPLLVFSLPGVAVYDGERLFLTSFPLWAIFVGRGWLSLDHWLADRTKSPVVAKAGCLLLLVCAAYPLVTFSPCHLCYYNSVERMLSRFQQDDAPLFEIDYWGEGVTRELLQELVAAVPANSTVGITPTLHQFQADDYRIQSPVLRSHGIKFVEFSPDQPRPDYLLVYRRLADQSFRGTSGSAGEIVAKTTRDGRLLAYLLRLGPQSSSP
ncbi:ArnT family glycosyltransferase [Schlesneria sp. T3-172]|uniref:ArnT family glycosyltransferase n=1 Tax=Schlesneria TaxID=656899 RepID=UPI002F050192